MKTPPFKYLVPGVLAGLALAYTGFGFLAVPAIIKSQAAQFAAGKLHRQLTIDKAEFNPFTLRATVHGLKLTEPDGASVFASFDELSLDIAWQSVVKVAPVVQEVRLVKPAVQLVRKDANHYNFDDILAYIASQPPSPEPARYAVNNIQLEGGTLSFDDRPAGVKHEVADLTLGLPFISSLPSDVEVFVEPLFSAKVNGAPLRLSGKARPFAESQDYVMALDLDNVDLAAYLGYLPSKPNFRLQGARLSAKLQATFTQPKNKAPALLLGGQASLKGVALQQADGKPVLKLKELSAQLGKLDVLAGRYELAAIRLDGLDADLVRGRDGRLNVETLLAQPAAPHAPAKTAVPVATPSAAPYVSLKTLDISNAAVRYTDGAMRTGVEKFALAVRDIKADLGKNAIAIASLASDSAGIDYRHAKAAPSPQVAASAQGSAPLLLTVGTIDIANWSAMLQDDSHEQPTVFAIAPLSLALRDFSTAPASRSTFELKANVNKTGQLALGGELALAPFKSDLKLDLKNIGLLPLQPYITDYVNLRVARGNVSGKGRLQLETVADGSLHGGFTGDVSIGKLSTVDKVSSSDFLSWESLAFNGMDLQLQPFSLSIERVALADFFSRVIIDPNGRLNVQDVKRDAAAGDKSLTDAGERAQAAVAARRNRTAVATPAAPAPAQPAAPLPPIRIGQLALSGGRVRFTDNFIKPNYTANLREIGGTISGLSSDERSSATVSLKGNVNSAPLSIAGRVNPLKRELSLDLKADVRGMELAQLSAYADKYVGYGIEKGKLSFEVAYQLEGRQLRAENRLMLDQLTFGKESSNPDATRLPVQLAVALLSDRNGVIDLNVPIGGSLDDPEFSIGGIILKIIGNAVVKTVTAPFAMLGSLFGGGEELSTLDFDTGRAQVPQTGEAKLKSLAAALTERPGLRLDITGRYDPATETEALRRIAMERKLRVLKTRDLQAKNTPLPEGGVVVAQSEYADLLARVFRDEPFAKPRNVLGLQKSLPVQEMEKLILANTTIDDDDLLALGNRRAQAVRDWLVTKGQVPAERIFIVGAKPSGQEAKGRVEFSLH